MGLLTISLLSAIVGTAAMTVSSETEMILSEREPSPAPGRALSSIIQLLGGSPLEGRNLKLASTWVHWLYGLGWGVVFWLLIDEQSAGLSLPVAGAVFFVIVWGAAQIVQPLLGVGKPTFAYGAKATAIDGFHHVVFAAATTGAAALYLAALESLTGVRA
jgi:hypothetical protein